MTSEFVVSFGRQAIYLAILLASPILIAALAVGFLVSIFQAVTQIQEMTLAIIPKMLAVVLVILFLAPWFLEKATSYMGRVFTDIPKYIGLG